MFSEMTGRLTGFCCVGSGGWAGGVDCDVGDVLEMCFLILLRYFNNGVKINPDFEIR
jgi:hypothetical protein